MKYWCCCCRTWTQLSWDHSWRIGNVKFNINYSLILCRVSQHEPRHVLSYATYIFIPIQMTSPFCLHFIHVLFFEILLPICRSSLLISYCLLVTACNENLYLCVKWHFLSLFFSLRKNAKQHQDKHQVCVRFNASLQPMSSSFFFLFHHSSFVSFQRLTSGNNIYNLCDLLHEAIIFMELPNFYEVISLLSICFTDILVFHFMI